MVHFLALAITHVLPRFVKNVAADHGCGSACDTRIYGKCRRSGLEICWAWLVQRERLPRRRAADADNARTAKRIQHLGSAGPARQGLPQPGKPSLTAHGKDPGHR